MAGRIKIHRQLVDWEWYEDNNTFILFTKLLLLVNYKDKKRRGIDIPRGSIVTSRDNLSKLVGLSVQKTRTALEKLKSTGEVTIKTTSNYTMISIVKYDLYQDRDFEVTSKLTNKQPASNQQVTTTKESKKERSKENTKEGDFEELRIAYPHSRQAKKKDTKSFWNQCTTEHNAIVQEAKLLRRKVVVGEQNPQFIPAMQRRMRDFIKTDGSIVDKFLYKAMEKLQGTKDREEFVKDWGEARLKKLYSEVKKQARHEKIKALIS